MNTQQTYRGYVIKAVLDDAGKQTGVFLVIGTDGEVVHRADSLKKAMEWIDKLEDKLEDKPEDKPEDKTEGDPKPPRGIKMKK